MLWCHSYSKSNHSLTIVGWVFSLFGGGGSYFELLLKYNCPHKFLFLQRTLTGSFCESAAHSYCY